MRANAFSKFHLIVFYIWCFIYFITVEKENWKQFTIEKCRKPMSQEVAG